MADDFNHERVSARRDFLRAASLTAAASGMGVSGAVHAAQAKAAGTTLPTIQLGPHRVTRLIAGWNPIGGHAHAVPSLAKHMLEYFTAEQTNQFLENCEQAGITGWQLSSGEKATAAVRALRERGSKLKIICLHSDRNLDEPMKKTIQDTGCFAMVHHGGVTDSLFRAGKSQEVHDFVKRVHDCGILAGVSSHCPDNVKRIADEGWENDLFMTCFYYVTRPREEQQAKLGKIVLGEPFFESDPIEMTAVVRQVEKPCLGFKIFAAGRLCSTSYSVRKAFQFALGNIKPIDGLIVGMYPRFQDEISQNVQLARELGAV